MQALSTSPRLSVPHLAILHYHLNRGGVTQVVLNQLRALDQLPRHRPLQVALIHGGRREGTSAALLDDFQSIDLTVHTLPALDYDDSLEIGEQALTADIRGVLDRLNFRPSDTLLHIHNHALGKNVSLPSCVRLLAAAGYGIVLQLHDFAEDQRPSNYRRLWQAGHTRGLGPGTNYPQAARIHYATLNGRDADLLRQAGVDPERLHVLPNPVDDQPVVGERGSARAKLQRQFGVRPTTKYVVYPVRGIRRKNLGEMLLWSALCPDDAVFGVTLAPLNPAELPTYQRWTQLAEELQLACLFATGGTEGLTLAENLAAADVLMTTSVAEGFGMVFLEAWLAGLQLAGRNLPEITRDFVRAGVSLTELYDSVPIPIPWLGRQVLQDTLLAAYRGLLEDYGWLGDSRTEERLAQASRGVATLLRGEHVDFGLLTAEQQACVIRRVCRDTRARERLLELTPQFRQSVHGGAGTALIQDNATVIRQVYSFTPAGLRLQELYAEVAASPAATETTSLPRAEVILAAFLDISRLRPLRFTD